eukprot:TRINITY_DN72736_c0_g1_i2.p1 TRINITY_DN72736_c0_g1~~TRINITY_DN72736_c0_g1_i2.p1  ORF type:complete len:329 (-),score=60.71 TRINITY_DN72736_c0_g1_i2:364-1350(-)
MYCAELQAGLVDGTAYPKLATESPSAANVDGQNGLGAVVSKFAMEVCIAKAKKSGIGLVVCHHSNHYGIAGYWADMAMQEGLIGFSFTNTSPFMIPTRAFTRAGGTNPISCYCPAGQDSFQLDMATTTVPVGKVEVCHRKGQKIPLGWGVDKTGIRSTTDPSEVFNGGGLTPLGGLEETAGYKGYGLNMMVEILTAVLSGIDEVGPDVPQWNIARGVPLNYGQCFICISPEKLNPKDAAGDFQDRLAAYLKRMRGLPAADPLLPVAVPGDPEKEEEKTASTRGVRLNQNIALGVRDLAKGLGCEHLLPATIKELPADMAAPKHAFAGK